MDKNIQINVLKNIEGYIEGKDSYGNVVDRTFNFEMTGPKIKDKLTTSITTSGGTGTSSFSEIEFTFDDMVDGDGKRVAKKEFTYVVTETAGSDAGWTYDTETYNVVVTVEDDQAGHLTVTDITKVDDENNVKIINTFTEEEYIVDLNLTKVIEDQSGSAQDATFIFELSDAKDVVQTKTITTEGLTGSVQFDSLTFKEAGTFYYTLKEVAEDAEGWTFDTTEYPVVITVKDNFEQAKLEATVTIDGTATTSLTVKNIYKAKDVDAILEVTKSIEDTSGSAPEDTTFEFTLTAGTNDAGVETPMPTPATASVTGAGKVSFAAINYEKAGIYNYTIQETAGDGNGWICDETEYPVVVTVSDAGGHLTAAVVYGEKTSLTVTNIYDPKDAEANLRARKVIDDQSKSAPNDAEFTFLLLDKDGKEVETVTNGAGYVEFGTLTFDKVGTYSYSIVETGEAPNGWTYDTEKRDVKITVSDGNKGALTADVKYLTDEGEAVITNVYQATPVTVDPPVQKIFTGKDAEKLYNKGDFTFTIENVSAPEGVEAPMPKDKDGNTITVITNISEHELNNKKGFYEFGVIEFTVAGTYEYKVTESGSAPNVTNDPDAVTGKTLKFTVSDDGKGNLTISPTTDRAQFTFTNQYAAEIPTGDRSNMILWMIVMVLAVCVGATSLILLKKSSKKN